MTEAYPFNLLSWVWLIERAGMCNHQWSVSRSETGESLEMLW